MSSISWLELRDVQLPYFALSSDGQYSSRLLPNGNLVSSPHSQFHPRSTIHTGKHWPLLTPLRLPLPAVQDSPQSQALHCTRELATATADSLNIESKPTANHDTFQVSFTIIATFRAPTVETMQSSKKLW